MSEPPKSRKPCGEYEAPPDAESSAEAEIAARRAALEELARLGQEIGIGYES